MTRPKIYTKEELKRNRKKSRQKYRQKKRATVDNYKKSLRCKKCNFSFAEYPTVCDFHHPERDGKINGIPLARRIPRMSLKKIMEELKKCTLLCANCHRILHAEENTKQEMEILSIFFEV